MNTYDDLTEFKNYERAIVEAKVRFPNLDTSGLRGPSEQYSDWSHYRSAYSAAIEYLYTLRGTKTVSRASPSSYRLKHDVEEWSRDLGAEVYCPNGVLIVAALQMMFRVQENGNSVNVGVRMRDTYTENMLREARTRRSLAFV